jgi:HlyD family secretion protein
MMRLLVFTGFIAAFGTLIGCDGTPEADAYGNFEATEVTVSAQTSGRLLRFDVDEGDDLEENTIVGLVDTVQLALQRDALLAQRQNLTAQRTSLLAQQQATLAQSGATSAQIAEAEAQAGAVAAQLNTAREELGRTERLFADSAATARERNQRQGEVAALDQQLRQARARVETIRRQAGATRSQAGVSAAQAAGASDQAASLDAQIAQLDDRIREAELTNPVAGVVLSVLARRGEVVQPGSPLYTVADLDTLTLRAYVTGDQLSHLRLGGPVEVLHDAGAGDLGSRRGTVTWIAASAEFTPNTIQTRDERADLVYAFEVRVPNPDGALKIGMPGEVRFLGEGEAP